MWHLTVCKIAVSLSFLNWIKNHLIFDPLQERETNWNFTGCPEDARFYDCIITIYQFIKSFLDKNVYLSGI